ncbi:25S rRNA (adenine(645)-N(1))-methyltransferase [Daldinia childiae]|uniref:25S rRNA (adenine(645)-N(1))-methyltransferase n=1 Tax=Daldinia childiae TaxID=326645 RepID=UPI001445DCD2|nr:25S rRNA (adenine(645)-N(1))-methyltransferase [Daldinia childiae]KAF3062310.1 25S rRNA (adenine(645)-N(1))-methyltransferase [Daldinia childiae]
MFAVPGWSVSADGLKSETTIVAPKAAQDESQQSNKRKRPSSTPGNVNSSNVADLWERVIEGRSGKKPKPDNDHSDETPEGKPRYGKKMTLKEKKKLKKLREKEASQNGVEGTEPATGNEIKLTLESPDATLGKEAKKDKKRKSKDEKENGDSKKPNEKDSSKVSAPAPAAAAAPKLTPMQAAMREKLVSARFRHLNETLYTKPSADAFQLFADSPEMFQEYHEGFRRQVDVWPENPVEGYIKDIKLRGRQKPPQRSRNGHSAPPVPSSSGVAALPRTSNVCTIADLGCGDAKLAEALQSEKKKLRLEILSYDLQSPSPLVTRADIANLPLADGAADVVIFCLALMGTNWLDFVEEAYRILHWKGELWVAEIKSRFGFVGKGKGKSGAPVTHSVGNRRKIQGKKGKGRDGEGPEGEEDEKALAVEVDGADDKREETDVSAFVEALRKRGFVLQGAADLRNKMFVKMHFIKAASPTVGKGAVTSKEPTRGSGPKKSGVKFIDTEGDQATVDESSILKPCVYKLR